jgi:microcompartment protein CcmK/EutM
MRDNDKLALILHPSSFIPHPFMRLGKVVGTVVATQKDPKLTGNKLLVIREMKLDGKLKEDFTVAVDTVGAGVGECVLVCAGSSARLARNMQDCPVDAAVVGIVDTVEHDGGVIFKK